MNETSYAEIAIAHFNLKGVSPRAHTKEVWHEYLDERLRTEYKQSYKTASVGVTTDTVRAIIREAPFDLLLYSGIDEAICRGVTDGINIMYAKYSHTSAATIANFFVRIYLPNALRVIEVAFYHHIIYGGRKPDGKTHGSSVGFRTRLTGEHLLDYKGIERLFCRDIYRMFRAEENGFACVYRSVQRSTSKSDDENDFRWGRCVGIDEDDLEDLVVFSKFLEDTSCPRAMVLQWLLATVTICPGITSEGEVDEAVKDNAHGPFKWKFASRQHLGALWNAHSERILDTSSEKTTWRPVGLQTEPSKTVQSKEVEFAARIHLVRFMLYIGMRSLECPFRTQWKISIPFSAS
jgi:hypothetical protein